MPRCKSGPKTKAAMPAKVKPANVAKFFGMIANIDDNVGRLLAKLKAWDLTQNTLFVFMNDNGGTAGVQVFNAGMRGQKVTPWLGGTRAASFWRWPGTLKPADVPVLCGHIDFLPTIGELAGAKLTEELKTQVEGRSLVPLLRNPAADWPGRTLFTHMSAAGPRDAAKRLSTRCSVRTTRGSLLWRTTKRARRPGSCSM